MKKFSEAVLAPNKHMAKKASPYHPHSQGLVYTPKGKEEVRPIDTADAGYGGETVADAEGGDANPGIASKKAVSPMPMQTLVKPGLDKAKKAKTNEETERERLIKLRSFAAKNRVAGLGKAMVEEEQIDELKKSTLASYAKKATDDVSYHSFMAGTMSSKDPERLTQDKKAMKRQAGVIKAVNKLAKEEAEVVGEATGVTNYNPKSQGGTRAELLAKLAKSKNPGHATAARKAGATQSELKAAMMKEENDGTEADQGEYGYEGDMAMSQLKSIIRNAQSLHDHMEPQTDLPEWLQAKITLASDYIQTAADYWKSEKEEVSEGKMKDIATDKAENERLAAQDVLGGPVRKKPEGPKGKLPLGFRLARSAAKKAMKSVSEEQIDELMGPDLRSQQAKENDAHFKKQPPRMQTAIRYHLKNRKSYKDAVSAAEKDVATMHEEVWDKPMPDSKKQGSLSPEQKAKAKARAERAGRSYPNMIDNMWASKQ
jgi:hypothetical protein